MMTIHIIQKPYPYCPIPSWHPCCSYLPAEKTDVMRTFLRAGWQHQPASDDVITKKPDGGRYERT